MTAHPGNGRPTGRPPTISREAVLAAGVEIGLEKLSVAAVAERLGVTRTSVHRHVGSQRDLELSSSGPCWSGSAAR